MPSNIILNNLQKLLKTYHSFGGRDKIIIKNIFSAGIFKIITILCFFLNVRYTLNYLDTYQYGVWLTLSTFITWFTFFDLGFGNGLKNNLVKVNVLNNKELANVYVSTTLALFIIVFTGIFVVFGFIASFSNWSAIFNTQISNKSLFIIILFSFGCLSLKLILNIINVILQAHQKNNIVEGIMMVQQLIILLLLYFLNLFQTGTILPIAIINGIIPVFVLFISNIYYFSKHFPHLIPRLKSINFSVVKNDFGQLGLYFLFIQLSGIILFTTQNFLVSHLFEPGKVVLFDASFKYFNIVLIIFGVIIAPYWSMITEAYTRKDLNWIETSMKRLFNFWFVIVLILSIMLLFAPYFFSFWLNKKIEIPFILCLFTAIFVSQKTWNIILAYFVNGTGKIKIQLYVSLLGVILYIPSSIILVKYFEMGLVGISIANILSLLPGSIFIYIQYRKVISKNAKGIWNE